jgi:hypothetical protein
MIVELAAPPLGIGRVNPDRGTSSGGTAVDIIGSGFKPGAVVFFGEQQLSPVFVDQNTLHAITPAAPAGPVRISVMNPDGERYQLDAAFYFSD